MNDDAQRPMRAWHRGLRLTFAATALAVVMVAPPAVAQVQDTTRVPPTPTPPAPATIGDTVRSAAELQPPLSPRRAFLYSLAVPGYAQSVLGRGRTGTLLMAFEALSLVMIREMHANVREARRFAADSVIVSYVNPDGTAGARYERTTFPTTLVRSRREQAEDWIAVLIANHLFAAADAYVAALLWDLPAEMGVQASPRRGGAQLELRLRW